MTRKALRKKRQQQAPTRQPDTRLGPGPTWLAVGAFVAAAAFAPHAAAATDPILAFARRDVQGAPTHQHLALDARLAVVDQALRARSSARQAKAQTAAAGTRHGGNAIRQVAGTPHRVRTDLSATLFLSEPSEYDGGELIVEDTYGTHGAKLPAGHLVLYPATSLHRVVPVTRGARVSSFFWIQSMIRDDGQRTLLFDLDAAIQRLNQDGPDHPSAVQCTAVYHNLLRRWAEL